MKVPLPARQAVAAVIVVALLAAFPLIGGKYEIDLIARILVLAIFALSLELLVGQTGLVSFGHAAFFGLGAYTTALLLQDPDPRSFWLILAASMLVAGAYALPVAALSLRTRGVYFIMVTLAFAQLVYYVFHDTKIAKGSDGIYLTGVPEFSLAGWVPFNVTRSLPFYYVALGALCLVYALLVALGRSRFGRALAGIRVNEQRMRAAGFATYPYKIAAFVVAAMLAGLAGFLKATKDGYVNPEMLAWHESGAVLLMIILGGLGKWRGAVLGAFAFVLLQEFFKNDAVFGEFAKRWQLLLGFTIIACVLFLPHGLIGLPARLRQREHRHG
ncbi:MAG TPA: branched-chain amino acid ABC transporter permease [Burkholderiaceae bacterium]|nr:branched-chain amino acid ABC transporter permease [Burkholderiaceae bacterium]